MNQTRRRLPKDCEYGLPYVQINREGRRVNLCEGPPQSGVRVFKPSPQILHSRTLRPLINFIAIKLNYILSHPKIYLGKQREKLVKYLEFKKVIIGGGTSGLSYLDSDKETVLLSRDVIGDLQYDSSPLPLYSRDALLESLKGIAKRNSDRIMRAEYLGKFDEGLVFDSGEEILVIKAREVVFATGARYVPPLIKGGDLPGLVSKNMFLRNYASRYRDNVVFLGSSDEAIKAALNHVGKSVLIYREGTENFTKFYLEKASEVGLEIIGVREAKLIGRNRVKGIETEEADIKAELVVYAISKQPRIEPIANFGCPYRLFEVNHTYVPIHDLNGRNGECVFVGGARGIYDPYLSIFSSKISLGIQENGIDVDRFEELLRNHNPPLHLLYTGSDTPRKSPYIFSEEGYVCECENVSMSDVRWALRMGYNRVEEVKRITGACTGACQGKQCSYLLGSILRDQELITFRSPLTPLVI